MTKARVSEARLWCDFWYIKSYIDEILDLLKNQKLAREVFVALSEFDRPIEMTPVAVKVYRSNKKSVVVSRISNSGCFEKLLIAGLVINFHKSKGNGFFWRLSSIGDWVRSKWNAFINGFRDPMDVYPESEFLRLRLISKGWMTFNLKNKFLSISCTNGRLNALSLWLIESIFAPPCPLILINPQSTRPIEVNVTFVRNDLHFELVVIIRADGKVVGDNRIEKMIEYIISLHTVRYFETILSLDDEIREVYDPDELLRDCFRGDIRFFGSHNGLLLIEYEATLSLPERRLNAYDCN